MSYCIIHPNKPSTRKCTDCATNICRNCTFEEVVRSRTTSYSSVDRVIQQDYGFFCPTCFISYAEQIGYQKGTKGMLFDTKRTKAGGFTLIFPFWMLFSMGILTNLVIFPWGLVLLIPVFPVYLLMKNKVENNFRRYHHAKRMLQGSTQQPVVQQTYQPVIQQPVAQSNPPQTQPSKPSVTEDVIYCSKCGTKNPAASFCKSCGAKLLGGN